MTAEQKTASAAPIPLLDLKAQFRTVETEVRAAIDRVLESQHFILGPEVEGLEREIAAYSRCAAGIGCSSGTDALLAALMAANVGPGDEVISTPYTFVATAMCVARLGARAVLVDIEPGTYNLDPERVIAALTPRTRVVMPVHLYGQMADLQPILAACRPKGIVVIEDAAQAIGAERDGLRAGEGGDLGCLSFFPSKNLGGLGDGGMVVSNHPELADRTRLIRNQGQRPKYYCPTIGGNFRLDALHAAVLRAKLPHLDGWTEARQRNAARYRALFAEAGFDPAARTLTGPRDLVLPYEAPQSRHVYNQFVIRVKDREGLKAHLGAQGIGTEVYYPQPMHLQECFAAWGHHEGDFPESESAARETLAIPVYPELPAEAQARVVAAVRGFLHA